MVKTFETSALLDWKSKFHPIIYPNIHLMAKNDSEKLRSFNWESA
jgi:hypothetical protein